MANYSLKQRRMTALSAGENKITLTLEEADEILEQLAQYDRKLAEYSDYLPEDVIRAECEEMYGPRPDDSKKRCVYCNTRPTDDEENPCCDGYDGSFYWVEIYEEDEMFTKEDVRTWYEAGRNMDEYPDQDAEYGPLHVAYEMGEQGDSFSKVLAELGDLAEEE